MREFYATAPPDRKKEGEKVLERFNTFWTGSWMTDDMQEQFVFCANAMLKRQMRPFPQFEALIDAFISFSTSEVNDQVEEWKNMVLFHVAHDVGSFHQKMAYYTSLYGGKSLYSTPNAQWRAEGSIDKIGVNDEPFVSYVNVDLIGASQKDSLTIFTTSGSYLTSTGRWKGKGGEVLWDRAGLNFQVHAELADYEIKLSFPSFTAENATLYYPEYFTSPLKGTLSDKAGLEVSEEKATYPRFKSYDNIAIPNFYDNVDYIGGFELRGASVFGSSSEDRLSSIIIKRDHKPVVWVRSLSFLFKNDNILSSDAGISIYFENDSLYHTNATVKFNSSTKELMILRPTNGVGRSPFLDSYHKLDIYAESMVWIIDEEKIQFKPIMGQSAGYSAIFESHNYFDESVMYKIKGYNEKSPLYTLWEVFKKNDFKDLPFQTIVSHFRKSVADIRQLLIDLAAQGFVEYDTHLDIISYRPKIAHYLNNEVGTRDYDQIKLESKSHSASIDLLNNDLRINGCEFFVLSDARIVNVYPTNESVVVKKNRNMQFSGRIIAGLFDFVAHNCKFDYDRFEVEMNVIDSMIMYVEDKEAPQNLYGEHKLRGINSIIEDLAGTLSIDKPANKSGRVNLPEYPMFESRKDGKVFYDRLLTLGGHYNRDQFYYTVNPFKITNLDNFVIDSMNFNGYLVSGGIFPDIHQPLVIRPDFSLGFIYNTNQQGLPMYEGKGYYHNNIDLSNKGLRGKGDIHYLTSFSKCDSLTFYLDKTSGNALQHEVTAQIAGTEFPHATVNNAALLWRPYNDELFIRTRKENMAIFDETELTGFSKITPHGMYGGGLLKFKRADISSNNFFFKHHELLSDTSDLRIYALNTSDFVFTTDNYKAHIDFQTRKGHFESNGDVSEVVFVKNAIRTNVSKFDWNPIDENVLVFKWDDDQYKNVDVNNTPAQELIDMNYKNQLIATLPEKNGLRFGALTAEFDFGKNIIHAGGVRFINVGDGAVVPRNGEVTICEKADLEQFTASRIIVGRQYKKNHELYNARVKVTSGNRLRGTGYYDYIDENKSVQTIFFDTLYCIGAMRADGKITSNADFKLSPHFGFDGRAELHSNKPFVYFVGGVGFLHDCDSIKPTRLRILQEVDPDNIMIEVHNRSKDVNDRKAVIAIASANTTGRIYTCFGAAKEQVNDAEYISVFGFITYDHKNHQFIAASKEKLENPEMPGNRIVLDDYSCVSTGTGAIDMGAKLGRVDFHTNGTIINYIRADSAVMHLTTAIDFFFNDEAMKSFNKAIEHSFSLEFVSVEDDELYELALLDLLGEKDYAKYQSDMFVTGQVKKLPQQLQIQFLFSNIDFEWDKENSSFVSQKELPVVICGAEQVYKMIPGRIVIEKRGSRNRLYILFSFDNQFYLFHFENNTMYGFSSDQTFVDAIKNTKAKKRSLAPDNGKPAFTYRLGNKTTLKKLLAKYPIDEEETLEN
jgi:hypothetical protein